MKNKGILVIEPFYGGSHKQLIDFLQTLSHEIELHTLPDKKWHWRARTSALYFSQTVSKPVSADILFCSSVLNLSELCSLRPDIAKIPKKIVYFHENQLAYPVQSVKARDFQYGYNQILTCLVADIVLFNSTYNLDSFLGNLKTFFKIQPDFRPDIEQMKEEIASKAQVLYFPVKLMQFRNLQQERNNSKPLHIVWPHRWEHDKNPKSFFETLFKLKEAGENFKVSILGEQYQEIPEIFNEAKEKLEQEILHFGWVESKEKYFEILSEADVVVSTANHEFFGVAMLEAASGGCLPLVPNRLVYPELYPKDPCVYNTDQQLFKKLKMFCQKPHLALHHWSKDLANDVCSKYSVQNLQPKFERIFIQE